MPSPRWTLAYRSRYGVWPMGGAEDPPAASPGLDAPPAPDGAPPGTPDPPPDPALGKEKAPESFSREYVEELRREAAAHRKKAADLEKWRSEREKADLTEEQRKERELTEAQAEVAALRAQQQALVVRHAIEREAVALDFARPDDGPRYIELRDVEVDEDGQPKNLRPLLKAVLDARPYLKKGPSAPSGPPATPRPQLPTLSEEEKARQAVGIRQLW